VSSDPESIVMDMMDMYGYMSGLLRMDAKSPASTKDRLDRATPVATWKVTPARRMSQVSGSLPSARRLAMCLVMALLTPQSRNRFIMRLGAVDNVYKP